MSELAGGLIAVGVDGSPASVAALRWAADLAQLRDAEIVVVRAWHVGLASLAPYAPVRRRPTQEGERSRAEADLARAMRTALGPAPDVKVRAALVCGPPACVLLNQCADADLLVLGGHHADSPLRQTVGATAAACLRQAPCPVVIVTVAAAWPWRVTAPGRGCLRRPGPGYRRHGFPGHCRSHVGRISRR
jgi:nucleotide-binding universal stress UspA family protein